VHWAPVLQSTVRAELRDWDLWGPLFICMSLAVMLSLKAHDEASLVFSVIFVIMWVGAAVVTVNGQLLGGRLSFFQSVCLLGYCVFPILLSAGVCLGFNSFLPAGLAVILRFVAVVIALLWANLGASDTRCRCGLFAGDGAAPWVLTLQSCRRCFHVCVRLPFRAASSSFMTDAKFPDGRKLLALYPVFLFYLSLAWMVLIGFQQGQSATTPAAAAVPPPAAVDGTRMTLLR
jgi:protein YIPF6